MRKALFVLLALVLIGVFQWPETTPVQTKKTENVDHPPVHKPTLLDARVKWKIYKDLDYAVDTLKGHYNKGTKPPSMTILEDGSVRYSYVASESLTTSLDPVFEGIPKRRPKESVVTAKNLAELIQHFEEMRDETMSEYRSLYYNLSETSKWDAPYRPGGRGGSSTYDDGPSLRIGRDTVSTEELYIDEPKIKPKSDK